MENRRPVDIEGKQAEREPEHKLQADENSRAYEAGSQAARDAFGKVGELLIKESAKRRPSR